MEVRISLSLSPGFKVTLVFLNKLFFSQSLPIFWGCVVSVSVVCGV